MRTLAAPWAQDMDNTRRHCMDGNDGRRWLWNGMSKECHANHTDNPKVVGNVEWLRFIHAFGKATSEMGITNPFAPPENKDNFFLLNETDGHSTTDLRLTYCETYLHRPHEGWGLDPVFRVFLANDDGWSRIECYDASYTAACEIAWNDVQAQWKGVATHG